MADGLAYPSANIKSLAAKRGFLFGMASRTSELQDAELAAHMAAESSILVGTNAMQWHITQPSEGVFNYAPMQAFADFSDPRGIAVRGHALVYPLMAPQWLKNKLTSENWETVLGTHVAALGANLPRPLQSIDVANEVFDDTVWGPVAGADWIRRSFELARECFPDTKLALCDYGTEHSTGWHVAKRQQVLTLLEELASAGLIDAFHAQGHMNLTLQFDEASWRQFLRDVNGLGLKVNISEFDVFNDMTNAGYLADYHMAQMAKRLASVWLEEEAGDFFMTWGQKDDLSWRQDQVYTYEQRPLPWFDDYAPKQMERELRRAFSGAY